MVKSYSEDKLQRALLAVKNGASVRSASSIQCIPRSTLQGQLEGQTTIAEAKSGYQRLSPIQEEHLTAWAITQEAIGLGLIHTQLRAFAARLLKLQGEQQPLGQRWVNGFLRRNPLIITKRNQKIDSNRITGATTTSIRAWFQNFNLPAIRTVKPANRWNIDEAGIAEGLGSNGLILGSRETSAAAVKKARSRTQISFIKYISADSQALDPLVIYKGKSVQQQWFPTALEQYTNQKFTATPNRQTTNETGLEQLVKVFIPSTQPTNPQEPRLLVLDSYGSHCITEFIQECFVNKIFLLFLPVHTLHLLQPLDLSVFSLMKIVYQKYLAKKVGLNKLITISKRLFLSYYYKSQLTSLTGKNIRSGQRVGRLQPVNVAKPLISRNLIDLEGNPRLPTSKTPSEVLKKYPDTPNQSASVSEIKQSTPRGLKEVYIQLSQYVALKQRLLITQQLLRKLKKGFNILTSYNPIIDHLNLIFLSIRPTRQAL